MLNNALYLLENPLMLKITNAAIVTPWIPSIETPMIRWAMSRTSSRAFTHKGAWALASAHVENRPRSQSDCVHELVALAKIPRKRRKKPPPYLVAEFGTLRQAYAVESRAEREGVYTMWWIWSTSWTYFSTSTFASEYCGSQIHRTGSNDVAERLMYVGAFAICPIGQFLKTRVFVNVLSCCELLVIATDDEVRTTSQLFTITVYTFQVGNVAAERFNFGGCSFRRHRARMRRGYNLVLTNLLAFSQPF